MDLFNEEEELVNLYSFYKLHGISEVKTIQLVLHILLTQSYGTESDARRAASEFDVSIPYVLPDSGHTH